LNDARWAPGLFGITKALIGSGATGQYVRDYARRRQPRAGALSAGGLDNPLTGFRLHCVPARHAGSAGRGINDVETYDPRSLERGPRPDDPAGAALCCSG